jgi:hypothetical protein
MTTSATPGLSNLPTLAKEPVQTGEKVEYVSPAAGAIAGDSSSTSILNNMQKMLDEYNSPYKKFQDSIDKAIAYTHYDPTAALQAVNQKEQNERATKYNIAQNMANVGLLRDQLSSINSGFTGQPQAGQAQPQAGQNQNPQAPSGYQFKGVPLSVYEYQTLQNYIGEADLAGFNSAFKAISDIHSQSQLNPAWGDRVDIVVTGVNKSGKPVSESLNVSKKEAQEYQERGVYPAQIRPYISQAPEQKKAEGGAVQHLAVGGQPDPVPNMPMPDAQATPAPAPAGPAAAAPSAPVVPGSGMQGGLLDKALSSIMGSAEAAPQGSVSVSGMPAVGYGFNPKAAQIGTESGARKDEAANAAALKQEEAERKAAGEFISSIENLALNTDEVQGAAKRVKSHAASHPEEFGWSYGKGSVPMALSILEAVPNLIIPGSGSTVEKIYGNVSPSIPKEALERRVATDADAKKLGLDFAKQMFPPGSGARLGLGLVGMASEAKGVGTSVPASVNALNADLIDVAAEKRQRMLDGWGTYKKANPGASAYDYMRSPDYKNINKWVDEELKRRQPEAYKTVSENLGHYENKATGHQKTPGGVKYKVLD